jgi:methyl-accepting chemotaxis protein
VFRWLVRSEQYPAPRQERSANVADSKLHTIRGVLVSMRQRLGLRIRELNQMTADEVTAAARLLDEAVERARSYVDESRRAVERIEGRDEHEHVGKLLGSQSALLRDHAREMSGRAAVQDERARQAAAAAKSIGDLAGTIDRLAGEARLLAVNARIESARLGAQSAGFQVLASEMQRLSDEVAGANDRVSELAVRLGSDLPWIAQHARDLRTALDSFAMAAADRLAETERGVATLREDIATISRAGGAAMADILRMSRAALSHLQFQDVVAQELRIFDAKLRETHVQIAQALGADSAELAAIPAAEYVTQGAALDNAAPIAPSGDVVLF